MDSLITAAARALAAGDMLGALKRVALREDPPALALRGIAMAQLGDLVRAKALLRSAARGFGPGELIASARCALAEAEIALVSRDLVGALRSLEVARATLARHGDRMNAAHAGYLLARCLLLIGRLDEAEAELQALDADALQPASRTGAWLVAAGIAMRRIRATAARDALAFARRTAQLARIPSLAAEVERAAQALDAPAARLVEGGSTRLLDLAEVEALMATDRLVVDACRSAVRAEQRGAALAGRPVLFALLRALTEAWPGEASREALLLRAFGARHADESHRARLRVEIGRLRREIAPLARIGATPGGFRLTPHEARAVSLILPPVQGKHAEILALLADGEAWSSSALALALGVSPRTAQRGLEALARGGGVEAFGQGRARRWTAPRVPGFPTTLLLPASPPAG